MTSGNTNTNRWTTGSALPWLLGVTLGLIVGIALLIIIPRTLGSAAAPAATEKPAETAASAPAAGGTEAAAPAAGGAPSAEGGKTFFASNCAGCHGANAEGGVGPKLDQAAAWNLTQFGEAVHEGKAPDKTLAAMMPHFTKAQVSDAQLADMHAFLQQTFGVKAEAAPAATTPAPAAAPAAANTATTPTTTPAAAPAAEGDSAAGKEKFTANCAGCHGANAEGAVGPALKVAKDWTPAQFTAAVREGKAPDKALAAMMPHFTTAQLSDADLTNIHAFIKTLN